MLRRDAGQFNKWLGILYMVFQAGGAICGALLAFYFFDCSSAKLTLIGPPYYYVQVMVSEALGSFILVLAYLTQTEANFKLAEDAGITLLVISGAYCVAIALATPTAAYPSPLNPAIALAEMTFTTFSGNIDQMHGSWIYLVFPWVGAILGVLCFEMVFKRASTIVERHDDMQEEAEERRDIEVAEE